MFGPTLSSSITGSSWERMDSTGELSPVAGSMMSDQSESGSTTAASCNSSASEGPTENPYILHWYLQVVYCIAFAAMVVVAAGGNLIVIWIVLGHKRMRTVTNYFLVNLAVADALITIFNTMFNFIYMLHSNWPFGRAYCKFTQFIAPCTISASVFTFIAIAVDRYMVIVHPLKPRISARRVVGVICAIWVSSAAVAYPNLPYAQVHTFQFCSGDQRTVCYLEWPDGVIETNDFGYNIFLMLANYVAPLVALGVTYARVGFELWGSQTIGEHTAGHEESIKSKRKIVKMMVVVVAIFAVCWLPQHAFFIMVSRHREITDYAWVQHVYLIIYWLAMSNSMYNPIIYCWMNARFRSGFKYVLRWMPCVRWRPSDASGIWSNTVTRSSATEHTRCYPLSDRNGASTVHGDASSTFTPVSRCTVISDGPKNTWIFQKKYTVSCRLDSELN